MLKTLVTAAALAFTVAAPLAQDMGWSTYTDPSGSFSLELPLGVFALSPDATPEQPVFVEAGGAAQISLYGGAAAGLTLDDFATQFEQNDPGRQVTYRAASESWFVLSGIYQVPETGTQPLVFYTKVLLSRDRSNFSGFEISYPAEQKPFFDPIVERIEDSFTRPR
jgi:hypothetical protein